MSEAAPQHPIYTAPPIVEAVIQLGFEESLAEGAQRKLTKKLGRNYANTSHMDLVNANINFEERKTEFMVVPQTRLSSADEADVLMVQPSSLSWSRLAPYQGWQTFFDRASEDTQVAYESTGFRRVSRIGVRYINRIDIPVTGPVVRYEDFLAINIEIPETIPAVTSYGWRFEHAIPDQGLVAVVQSATAEAVVPNTAAFILDIDVINLRDVPTKIEDVLAKIGEMRHVKNHYFNLAIRDQAREAFYK